MKRYPKAVSVLIAVMALTSVLAACSGNDNNVQPGASSIAQPTDSNEAPAAAADPFGKYDPPIEVVAVKQTSANMKFKEGESLENNDWSKYYENELGIKVKYQWTASDQQYGEKMNVAIASNELPDIMEVSPEQFKRLSEDDQLADLTEAFEQYASSELKEIYASDDGIRINAAKLGGKLMGMPHITSSTGDGSPLLWIRTDWLEKLNLTAPQSFADLEKIADAFVNQDPDGNGKKDTYGIGLFGGLYGNGNGDIDGLLNSFHAYPKIWVKDANGQIVYGSVQPEMKAGLEKLQDLYARGLIDKEFSVKNSDKFIEDVVSGKIGLFYGVMWTPLWPLPSAMEKNTEGMDWQPFSVPSADESQAKATKRASTGKYYVAKKGFEHPEVIVKFMNAHIENLYGQTADWQKYSQGDGLEKYFYSYTNIEPIRKNLDVHLSIMDAIATGDTSGMNQDQKNSYDQVMAYKNGDKSAWGMSRVFDEIGSFSVIQRDYVEKDGFMNEAYSGAPTETMGEMQGALDKLEIESIIKIIMGNAPVSEFDKFVDSWKKLGGSQIEREINDAAKAQQ